MLLSMRKMQNNWHTWNKFVTLYRVFHGIRLLRLRKLVVVRQSIFLLLYDYVFLFNVSSLTYPLCVRFLPVCLSFLYLPLSTDISFDRYFFLYIVFIYISFLTIYLSIGTCFLKGIIRQRSRLRFCDTC